MKYQVFFTRRAEKLARKLPKREKERLDILLEELQAEGPIQPEWMNYSKLSKTEYHCHLSLKWVACWRNEKGKIQIEVYYAGSRENAPY